MMVGKAQLWSVGRARVSSTSSNSNQVGTNSQVPRSAQLQVITARKTSDTRRKYSLG